MKLIDILNEIIVNKPPSSRDLTNLAAFLLHDAKVDERGTKSKDVKDKIDWILYTYNSLEPTYIKIPRKQITSARAVHRTGESPDFFVYTNNKNANNGTINISRLRKYEDRDYRTNGIIALSFNGKTIGDIPPNIKYTNPNILSDQNIEYAIFGEGPNFTNSQMGGHPFYDWDLSLITGNNKDKRKVIIKDGQIIMITFFSIKDYVSLVDFKQWWDRVNENGEITMNNEDFTETLTKINNKWCLISKCPLETILTINDSTSEEDIEKIKNNV